MEISGVNQKKKKSREKPEALITFCNRFDSNQSLCQVRSLLTKCQQRFRQMNPKIINKSESLLQLKTSIYILIEAMMLRFS